MQIDRVQGLVGNLGVKAPCNCATTIGITLSGEQTIDGYACTATDNGGLGTRVLVKDQATLADNGIYYCNTTAWQRAPDFDGDRDVAQGTRVYVVGGTVNANVEFQVTTVNPVHVGTTAITIAQYLPLAGGAMTATSIHTAASKAPLAAADEFAIWDSATGLLKKVLWSVFTNLFALLGGFPTVASAAAPDIFGAAGATINLDNSTPVTTTSFTACTTAQVGSTKKVIPAQNWNVTASANLILDGQTSGTYTIPALANIEVLALTTTQFKVSTLGKIGSAGATSAAAGYSGEYVSASQPVLTNFTTDRTFGDGASILLTGGDWDVTAVLDYYNNNATNNGSAILGISTTTGNSSAGLVAGDNEVIQQEVGTNNEMSLVVPNYRMLVPAGTTVTAYLKGYASYSAGQPQYRCRLSARRR